MVNARISPKAGASQAVPSARSKRRWIAFTVLGALLLALGLRGAVRSIPWAGPLAADALRKLVGRDTVTFLEETWSAAEDRWHLIRGRAEQPRSLDDLRSESPPPPATPTVPDPGPPQRPRFQPADVPAMNPSVAAKGDGAWRPIPDPLRPSAPPALFTTLLHPDVKRPWAEVFVIVVDLSEVRLHALPGTVEPIATTREGLALKRNGLIPSEHQRGLLAVFNGGFKSEHGRHGMFVEGVPLLPARGGLCTIVGFESGEVRIGTWERLAHSLTAPASAVDFWRQAAPCLVEDRALNPGLRDESTRQWGATIDKQTVIRRSAIGLDADRKVLFVAITNDTTAPAIAQALLHAGASDVAQLDVNWPYPKFVLFPADATGVRYATSLFKGFLVGRDDFVRKPYARDFFYLVSRSTPH